MEKEGREVGPERDIFSSYVKGLADKDKRIKSFEKVDIPDTLIAYKIDVEIRLGHHHRNLSFNLALFEKNGLKMGIYHPVMKIPSGIDFKDKIEQLNDSWVKKFPKSGFYIGETPDGFLTILAEGPAHSVKAEETEWISGLIHMSSWVSARLRKPSSRP